MKLFYLSIVLLFSLGAMSAQAPLNYHQWVFGYQATFNLETGINMLDFTGDTLKLSLYNQPEVGDIYILGAGASIVGNSLGEHVFSSNICSVRDSNIVILDGQNELLPGTLHDSYCPSGSYPTYEGVWFLPDLTNDSIYFLLYSETVIDGVAQEVHSQNIYFRTLYTNNGFVVSSTLDTLIEGKINAGVLSATLHPDGDKWWFVTSLHDSNNFEIILIGNGGVLDQKTQSIGPEITNNCCQAQTTFSPGSEFFAINGRDEGAKVYKFDPEEGVLLEHLENIPYPNNNSPAGLAFSPNNRFIYFTNWNGDLHQYDRFPEQGQQELIQIANVDTFGVDFWPISVGRMVQGPDCRIYVSASSTGRHLHVIHSPNEKGMACNFEELAITVPGRTDHNLPAIPMVFGVNECEDIAWFADTTTTAQHEVYLTEYDISVYPNPTSDLLTIQSEDVQLDLKSILIYSLSGVLIKQVELNGNTQQTIDLRELTNGMYIYRLSAEDVGVVKVGKLVVE